MKAATRRRKVTAPAEDAAATPKAPARRRAPAKKKDPQPVTADEAA